MEQIDSSGGATALQYEPLPRFPADALQDDSELANCRGVPNVANIWVRLTLLLGRFQGILDRTHARFFTRSTARAFLEQNGYIIVETRCTSIPPELMLTWALGALTRAFPGLSGYEIMFRAKAA